MRTRTALVALLGAFLVIASAEVVMRGVEDHIPVLSEWPTMETELKSAQFAALDETPVLLIVGSSVTEAAVDPERLVAMGAAGGAYNSAFPYFSPTATDIWLRDFLQPWNGLEVLIIGLPAWPPPTDVSNDPLTSGLIEAFGSDLVTDPLDDFALWRLRGLLADLEEATRRERAITEGLWTDLGHQTVYYDQSGGSLAGRFPEYGEPEMSDIQERALRRIVEAARSAGVTPVVLLEPGRFPDPVDDETVETYVKWLRALTDELGVEFWDTYSIEWDQSLFADEVHLNQEGSIEFTQLLGEWLLDLGDDPLAP